MYWIYITGNNPADPLVIFAYLQPFVSIIYEISCLPSILPKFKNQKFYYILKKAKDVITLDVVFNFSDFFKTKILAIHKLT